MNLACQIVMAGLDPAIQSASKKSLDGRLRGGHDGKKPSAANF
jgi:hypothetical protein